MAVNAQELADEIKRLAEDYGDTHTLASQGFATREEVDTHAKALHAAIDLLASLAAPQPAERKPLTVSQIWDNQTIMALNAKLALQMDVLMETVRAVEHAHGIGIPPTEST